MPTTPLPVIERKPSDWNQLQPVRLRGLDNRRCHRMLAAALQAGGHAHDALFGLSCDGDDRHQLRLALRQRASLVQHDGIDLLERLQRLGVLDQDARARAASCADHDRHRRRQAERTGTSDDQHGHSIDDWRAQAAVPGPTKNQTTNVITATARTAGTKYAATLSASR